MILSEAVSSHLCLDIYSVANIANGLRGMLLFSLFHHESRGKERGKVLRSSSRLPYMTFYKVSHFLVNMTYDRVIFGFFR